MKVSVLIEALRSYWQFVILIAHDISLAMSQISVPDRKAVLWWVQWSCSKNDYQLLSKICMCVFVCVCARVCTFFKNHEVVSTWMCFVFWREKMSEELFVLVQISLSLKLWPQVGIWFNVYCVDFCTYCKWSFLQHLPFYTCLY